MDQIVRQKAQEQLSFTSRHCFDKKAVIMREKEE
jgi:hypothetical protein